MTAIDPAHQAIEDIYTAAGTPDYWPQALQTVADTLGAAGASLVFQRADQSFGVVPSPSIAKAQLEYESGAWKLDCLAPRIMERSMQMQNQVMTDIDLATDWERKNHPFYTDFRHKYGLDAVMGAIVLPHPEVPVIISVHGKLSRGPFSSDKIQLCEQLVRHVEKSLTLTVRVMEADVAATSMADALAMVSCGVFITDCNQRIMYQNALAEQLIGGELVCAEGSLSVTGQNSEQFDAACQRIKGDEDQTSALPSPPIVVRARSEKRITLHVLPVTKNTQASQLFSVASHFVLAVEHAKMHPADPALLRDLLDITLAEARLASLVGAGKSPRDAAKTLRITEATARTVLKRIFAKTGVGRQSELAVLLSEISSRVSSRYQRQLNKRH